MSRTLTVIIRDEFPMRVLQEPCWCARIANLSYWRIPQ